MKKVVIIIFTSILYSCITYNPVIADYNLIKKDDKIISFKVFLKNTTSKVVEISYNLEKLNVGCGSWDTLGIETFNIRGVKKYSLIDNFLLENKKGEYRNFFNRKAIRKVFYNKEIIDLSGLGEMIIHCEDNSTIFIKPKGYMLYDTLSIDHNFLKVKNYDTKIRLVYVYRSSNGKLEFIKSNWINLKE